MAWHEPIKFLGIVGGIAPMNALFSPLIHMRQFTQVICNKQICRRIHFSHEVQGHKSIIFS